MAKSPVILLLFDISVHNVANIKRTFLPTILLKVWKHVDTFFIIIRSQTGLKVFKLFYPKHSGDVLKH